MGSEEALRLAQEVLGRISSFGPERPLDQFVVEELVLFPESPFIGKTLEEVEFRQRYSVLVVGIQHGLQRITSPGPQEQFQPNDRLLVLGELEKVEILKKFLKGNK